MPAVADRVAETSTTTGTGILSLAGALSGFRTFVSGVGGGNVCYYAIVHRTSGEWEVGYGTLTAGVPDTLSRTTVLASSNANALVNFTAGTKDVFVTAPAARTPLPDPVSLVTTLLGGLNVPGAVTLSSTLAVTGVITATGGVISKAGFNSDDGAIQSGYIGLVKSWLGSGTSIDVAIASYGNAGGGSIRFYTGGLGTERMRLGAAGELGFFASAGAVKQTAVPVTAAGIHAALVAYGLIS